MKRICRIRVPECGGETEKKRKERERGREGEGEGYDAYDCLVCGPGDEHLLGVIIITEGTKTLSAKRKSGRGMRIGDWVWFAPS